MKHFEQIYIWGLYIKVVTSKHHTLVAQKSVQRSEIQIHKEIVKF